jgi:PAB-dependent poly(A)-specific ribonuclease subunit 2
MLNAAVTSPEAKQFWSTSGCLPKEIGIIIEQGQAYCFEGDEIRQRIQSGRHNVTVYSLVGLVADIDSGQHQKSHLVSLVNGTSLPNRVQMKLT